MGHVIGTDTTYTGNPVSFNAVNNGTMKSVSVPFSYTQDLHGYANPWPAGGGKNKFLTTLETGTKNKVTASVDSDGFIHLSGTANATTIFQIGRYTFAAGEYYITMCPPGGSNSTYRVYASFGSNDTGNGWTRTFTQETEITFQININSGTNVDGLVFKPMICLSSEGTDFSPYANICPISGITGLSVYVSPTQDPDDATVYNVDWSVQAGTVYGGTLDIVAGVLTVGMVNIPSYNGETITEPWLSSMDAYVSGATPTTGAQVVYTLATPQTYQLTPNTINALVGQNYIWSSNNETLTAVLTAPATGFAGWLIKCVTNGTPVEIPLKYMRAETYTVTPDQRMEWSAERDVTGVLHRETVQNLPPKIEFNTPLMTNADINTLNGIIRAAFTNYLQRNITIQFYDPERNQYWEWDCYMPDVKYHIRNADTANNIINYEELRYAFIGY